MSAQIELEKMLELALATPEIGAVNFNVLRCFLYEIIKHINVQEKIIVVTEDGEHKSVYEAIREASRSPQSRLSERGIASTFSPSVQNVTEQSQSSPSQENVSEKSRSPSRTPSSFKQPFR